jgi:NADPH:quinone reductase-like Zn-dependent oxidoreductase
MRAVQITRFGGPEVLEVVDLPDPVPGDGQQLYEVSAAGVNFADTHHRAYRGLLVLLAGRIPALRIRLFGSLRGHAAVAQYDHAGD